MFVLFIAQFATVSAEENGQPIDEIVVAGHSTTAHAIEVTINNEMLVDTATALKQLPGANANRNGAITGIAQYRGMYGDRVAVSIDGHALVSGGPNSMDTPLSYVSPMIADSIMVERGISSVSSSPETIGGHVKVTLSRGRFGGEEMGISGFLGTRYSTANNLDTSAGRFTLSDSSHRLSLLAEIDNSSNLKTPSGMIRPSAVDRQRYDVSYSFTNGDSHLVIFAGKLRTENSGTAALPMDIRLIDTDLAGAHFLYSLSPRLSLEGKIALNDVDHIMDNFRMRSAPPPMMQRTNHATGTGRSLSLATVLQFDRSSLRIGFDGVLADHDATITNPNNAMFRIANFSAVKRDLVSAFAEWNIEHGKAEFEIGIRAKRVETGAGVVSALGVMGPAAAALEDAFNASRRDRRFDDIDAVAKYRYRQNERLEWRFEAARKSRAPSYQELYLWLPMEATGGLADGKTYIGDLGLQAETSNELNIGVVLSGEKLSVSPQVFFKHVDGYIQGVPSTNMAANIMSVMMTNQTALQFSNTDAEIRGADIAWGYRISDRFTLDGIATYVRGKRTDSPDNLYRLAPANGSIGLNYASNSWTLATRLVAYAKQNKVSSFNDEQATAGYELVNIDFTWSPTESLRLEARVENIFDTLYEDHLTGVNRAGGSDILVGDRIPGAERSFSAGVVFSF